MISFMIKKYIQKRAEEERVIVPNNYLSILEKIEEREISKGIHIKFSCLAGLGKFLNAYSTCGAKILLNFEYAFYFIFHYDDELENAFHITIGHELTHKEKQLIVFRLFPSRKS